MKWFSTRGEMIQVSCSVLAVIFSAKGAYVSAATSSPIAFKAATWFFTAASVGLLISFLLMRRNGTRTQDELHTLTSGILTVQDIEPELLPPTSKWDYKAKLRIVLQNESDKEVRIFAAGWEPKPGDIAVRPLSRHL